MASLDDNDHDDGIRAIADAMAWALANGWRTSKADLKVAGRVVGSGVLGASIRAELARRGEAS